MCGLGLSGLGVGHGERKFSPKAGPLATGGTIKPVCPRILRQGPSIKEGPAGYMLRDFRRGLGGGRMMITECFTSPFHSELETTA